MAVIYKGREKLIDYDLDIKMFESFGIKVEDLIPSKSGFFIFTNKGRMILKKVDYGEDEFKFITICRKYIEKSYDIFAKLYKTDYGSEYLKWNNQQYVILEMGDTVQYDDNDEMHIKKVVESIAKMKKASKGLYKYMSYEHPFILGGRVSIGNSLSIADEYAVSIDKYKSLVDGYLYKGDFDKLFLNLSDKYVRDLKESIDIFRDNDYEKICMNENNIGFSSNSISGSSFLIDGDIGRIMNLDESSIDINIKDLAEFIVSSTEVLDKEKTDMIVNTYKDIAGLDEKMINILCGFIKFPDRFCNLLNNYYEKKNQWNEETFCEKLVRYEENYEKRKSIIKWIEDIK